MHSPGECNQPFHSRHIEASAARGNGFVVGSAGDQWIYPKGTNRLNGLIEKSSDWTEFLQAVPILFVVSTAVVIGLAYSDSKAESRVAIHDLPSRHQAGS